MTLFPGAVLDSAFDGFASFILPSVLAVSRVFQLMSEHAASGGITDWDVSQVTLDTIFQRIVRHYRGPGGDGDDDDDDDDYDDNYGDDTRSDDPADGDITQPGRVELDTEVEAAGHIYDGSSDSGSEGGDDA